MTIQKVYGSEIHGENAKKECRMTPMIGIRFNSEHGPLGASATEGRLVPPPVIVRSARSDFAPTRSFWEEATPFSGNAETSLRASWHELIEILASRHLPEVPEVFEMPSAPTVRVRGRVRNVVAAPFSFVDELADRSE